MSYDSKTRIQVRKGTYSEWETANPVLKVGEPSYVTDSGIFRIGNGVDNWSNLQNIGGATQEELEAALAALVDSAPETLNTLNELAAAINDNPNFFNEVAYSGGNISQFTNDVGYLISEANDLTANVTWANVPDANITESSVVQHSGALQLAAYQIVDFQISGVTQNDVLVYNSGTSLWENNSKVVFSDTTGITGASDVNNIVKISQSDYDNLVSYAPNTIYFIT